MKKSLKKFKFTSNIIKVIMVIFKLAPCIVQV